MPARTELAAARTTLWALKHLPSSPEVTKTSAQFGEEFKIISPISDEKEKILDFDSDILINKQLTNSNFMKRPTRS